GGPVRLSLYRQQRACRMFRRRVGDLRGIEDNAELSGAGIERCVDHHIGASRLGTVGVYETERFFVVEDARPTEQLPAAGSVKRTPEQGDRPQILPSLAQYRVIPAQIAEQRDA